MNAGNGIIIRQKSPGKAAGVTDGIVKPFNPDQYFNQHIKHITAKTGDLHSKTESQKGMDEDEVELF